VLPPLLGGLVCKPCDQGIDSAFTPAGKLSAPYTLMVFWVTAILLVVGAVVRGAVVVGLRGVSCPISRPRRRSPRGDRAPPRALSPRPHPFSR